MKNNKGFGKFEVITMIVILLAIFAYLGYTFLGGTSGHKMNLMKDNAVTFSKAVTTNNNSFHNMEHVYLGEVIDEKLMKDIKNPVGKGTCSQGESFVKIEEDGLPYVTLKCGDYLIDHVNVSDTKDITIYEVGEWTETKDQEDMEEKTLYNCTENGQEVFDQYYEELYFVYLVNKKYGTDEYFASSVNRCTVTKKVFYRTKKEME